MKERNRWNRKKRSSRARKKKNQEENADAVQAERKKNPKEGSCPDRQDSFSSAIYLENEVERLEIARRGYEMVREKYSTEKRALQLLTKINDTILEFKYRRGFPV